jgi:predicted MPP superfamily phosphohydrolase
MKRQKSMRLSRRNFLRIVVYSTPLACLADALWIEPAWLAVRRVRLADEPTVRLLHFSDLHYKGDKAFLEKVIRCINELSPAFACFTGDIVEDTAHLADALELLSSVNCPLYGVPGNHEYWSGAPFTSVGECFRSTGGEWLPDRAAVIPGYNCLIDGRSGHKTSMQRQASESAVRGGRSDKSHPMEGGTPSHDSSGSEKASLRVAEETRGTASPAGGTKRILLTHYPALVSDLGDEPYDVILAGHSHGGQVRLPLLGALIVPYGVDRYDAGLYSTPSGPLHVSVGIGTFFLPVRFLCRPEVTVVEI